tara:strand:+ start:906 stop:1121 length:216 start_codon:yes stop_codon:yes gene_type:complete
MLERLSATLALVEDMVFVKDFFCIVFILFFRSFLTKKTVQNKAKKGHIRTNCCLLFQVCFGSENKLYILKN